MKLFEIKLTDEFDWQNEIRAVEKDLIEKLGNVNFNGGYCFHFALELFRRAKKAGYKVFIIADGGHVAISDGISSYDCKGIHKNDDALSEKPTKTWASDRGFMKTILSTKQLSSSQEESLAKLYKE